MFSAESVFQLRECKKKVHDDFPSKFEEEFKKRVRNFFAAKHDLSDHCLASAMTTWSLGERCEDSPVLDDFVLWQREETCCLGL